MKILAQDIFKKFPVTFCLAFIGTDGNSTQHPTQGGHQLTKSQFKNSPASYKNKLYKNIIDCLNLEIEYVQDGIYTLDEPLVGGAYIKMLYKYVVDGCHDLNRRLKYPELMEIVDSIAKVKDSLSPKEINKRVIEETIKVVSKMPYKIQFVFECLGYEV